MPKKKKAPEVDALGRRTALKPLANDGLRHTIVFKPVSARRRWTNEGAYWQIDEVRVLKVDGKDVVEEFYFPFTKVFGEPQLVEVTSKEAVEVEVEVLGPEAWEYLEAKSEMRIVKA